MCRNDHPFWDYNSGTQDFLPDYCLRGKQLLRFGTHYDHLPAVCRNDHRFRGYNSGTQVFLLDYYSHRRQFLRFGILYDCLHQSCRNDRRFRGCTSGTPDKLNKEKKKNNEEEKMKRKYVVGSINQQGLSCKHFELRRLNGLEGTTFLKWDKKYPKK
jgi:hypothetical protein